MKPGEHTIFETPKVEPRPVVTPDASEEELRALLGDEDYDELMAIRTRKADRAKKARVKELADAMCVEEGGKYQPEYSKLERDLNAIYEKAAKEAEALVAKGQTS